VYVLSAGYTAHVTLPCGVREDYTEPAEEDLVELTPYRVPGLPVRLLRVVQEVQRCRSVPRLQLGRPRGHGTSIDAISYSRPTLEASQFVIVPIRQRQLEGDSAGKGYRQIG
jgi:hypothetical protein